MSEYETDIVRWSERQSELLRRLARGEPPNGVPDWANIIEEVEDVGRSEVRAVRSLLYQAILHLLQQAAWPNADAAEHWRVEVRAALAQVEELYRPSMHRALDLERTYRAARLSLPETNDGIPAGPVAETCPYTVESLLNMLPSGH